MPIDATDALIGTLVEGRYNIGKRLYGEPDRAIYRGTDGKGGRFLVTVSGALLEDREDLAASLCPTVAGVAPVRSLGAIASARTALVEDEPAGEPLAQAMPLSVPQAAAVACGLFRILSRVHRLGRTAGGVRPELVWIDSQRGATTVTGLAPRAEAFFAGTQSLCVGTVPAFASLYLAPEQVAGNPGGPPADVFAACATVLASLSGRSPFGDGSIMSQMQAILASPGELPTVEVSPLTELLESGLAADPGARPSAAELALALEPLAGQVHAAEELVGCAPLQQAYVDYVRSPNFDSATELSQALDTAGYQLEAQALEAYADRCYEIQAPWPWRGHKVVISPRLPTQAPLGTVWMDVCELSPMLRVDTGWLALRPTASWQFAAFEKLAQTAPVPKQMAPRVVPLDLDRIACTELQAPVANLTRDEARLYANYFGKGVSSDDEWEQARDRLSGASYALLWGAPAREWVSAGVTFSEGARVFLSPETVGIDPDDEFDDDSARRDSQRRMILYAGAYRPDITFRTGVSAQLGLFEVVSGMGMDLPIRLVELLDRSRFWSD